MTRALPWVLALVGLLLFGWSERRAGALDEKIAATEAKVRLREHVIAHLSKKSARIDTVAGKASARYLTTAADYRRLRDSLSKAGPRTFDSSGPYVRLVQACDAALVAADTALSACAKQVAVRDSLLANKDTLIWVKDSLLTLERKRHPSRFGCVGGAAANHRGIGPGAACGIRF